MTNSSPLQKNDTAAPSPQPSRQADATPWQSLSLDRVFADLGAAPTGLASKEAAERLRRHGKNELPAKKPPTLLQIFLSQFKDPLIYVLLAAAVLSFFLKEYTDAGFILAVLLLNAALGTYQEANAEKSAAALQAMLKTMARVLRDGKELVIDAVELVPGDIVLLESGDRVPADLRIVEASSLSIDESFLTGENIPPNKRPGEIPEETALGDRFNMAFAGSRVMTGRCKAVVVGTAMRTEVGKIAATVALGDSTKAPLILRMERFSKQLTVVMLGVVILLGLICYFVRGMGLQEIFMTAVALAVSAIPEGLPVAITVALSIGVKRMAARNVIVRKLPAVEGLGSCTCIASDKTGTLTVNQQTVKQIVIPGCPRIGVSGEGYGDGELQFPEGLKPESVETIVREAAIASILCNEATLTQTGDGWEDRGDAMDLALLAFARKVGLESAAIRERFASIAAIPYESERKFAAAFNRRESSVQVSIKGALETVLAFCDQMVTPLGAVPVDRELIERETLALAKDGYRVLAIASGVTDREPSAEPTEGEIPRLTLLGLAAFMDPLRVEVKDAVKRCRQAGIRVVMVTGDHPATAFAIASELGIAKSPDEVRVGVDLAKIDESSPAFVEAIDTGRVFARVSPMQKVAIVEALKAKGNFVAVTGDGVNDAPALKKASCGVAMGSGTDVAKDTASIVVTDDNFASIEAGVEEGRIAYDNIRKVTFLLVSCGFAELILFTASILAGLPMPLLAVQLLWLNMATNGIQDVALAFEKGEPGVMKRRPRPPNEDIFNHQMIWQTAVFSLAMAGLCFGAWYWMIERMGMGATEEGVFAARNLLLLLMVLIENVQALNVRSERQSAFKVPLRNNWLLILGILGAQGLQILCMNIPFMQKVLRLQPVSFTQWLIMLGLALTMMVVMELFKLVYGRIRREPTADES